MIPFSFDCREAGMSGAAGLLRREGEDGGKPGAAVTAACDAGAQSTKNRNSSEAHMSRLETARLVAAAQGKPIPSAVRLIDRALARAGQTRSERRRLIADLKSASRPSEHNSEGAQS